MKNIFFILTFFIGITFTSFAQKPGTDNVQAKLINFYPNPASSVINFDFARGYDKAFTFQVYNFMGKKVYDLKSSPTRFSINLNDFFRGIYIFQLRDKSGRIIESGKFQVNK